MNHPLVATSLVNQGVISRELGDHSAALENFEKAYNIRKTMLGANHSDTKNAKALLDKLKDRVVKK